LDKKKLRNNTIVAIPYSKDCETITSMGLVRLHPDNTMLDIHWINENLLYPDRPIEKILSIWKSFNIGICGYGPSNAKVEDMINWIKKYQRIALIK